MKIVIMQPYFFPYIGYFQLMRAADIFIFYDDVQFIKRGWVNRNRILVDNKPCWLTLPVEHDSQTVTINKRQYLLDENIDLAKRKLRSAYEDAKYFNDAYSIVEELLDYNDSNVAIFNINLLCKIAERFGLKCKFLISSEIDQPQGVRGEEKIINLCHTLGADHYINAIGGIALYDDNRFASAGLQLSFLKCTSPAQRYQNEVTYFSIIHTIFNDGIEGCLSKLDAYDLVNKNELIDAN